MENIDEDKHLQLLDVQGILLSQNNNQTKNIIFSHKDKSLIYNLGSNIVLYNLKKNLKTFLQYFSSDILSIKYIKDDLNILVIISDNKPFPDRQSSADWTAGGPAGAGLRSSLSLPGNGKHRPGCYPNPGGAGRCC